MTLPLESESPSRDQQCAAMRMVLDRIGKRWTLVIVAILSTGPRRFNQLRRDLAGISQRMLTLTLRSLERDGLVSRMVIESVPPQVEYALTPLGRSLFGEVAKLLDWAQRNAHQMDRAQAAYDVREAHSDQT